MHELHERPCPCGRMTINDCAGECGEPASVLGEREANEQKEAITMQDFFGEVIHSYTRAEALEDGVLVDVSQTASEAGFVFPVALTAGVWADVNDIPEKVQGLQDPQGRLWDLLTVLRYTIKARGDGREMRFTLNMPISAEPRLARYEVKSHVGPGDEGEPVLTILRSYED